METRVHQLILSENREIYFSLSIQNSALEIATTMAFYLSIFLAAKVAPISRNVRQLVSKAQ